MRIPCAVFLVFAILQHGNCAGLCDVFEAAASNISAPCLKQMLTVCNNTSLSWRMFDASSKFLTSGMTYSNVIDYGNFPECLAIDYQDQDGRILGKFCGLSVLIVNVFLTPLTSKILTSYGVSTNPSGGQRISSDVFARIDRDFRDVLFDGVPYVISKYSKCVPDACTPKEVDNFYLYGHIADYVPLLIYTDLPCETVNSNTHYEGGDIAVIVFLACMVVLIVVSTAYDALCQNFQTEPYHPLLLSFSVLYNGKKLLEISKPNSEQIECFNGMRFISMMWVLAYHGASAYEGGVLGLENYAEVQAWNDSWTSRYITSGLLSVDTFFFISGFLLAFTYLKRSLNESPISQITKVPKIYIQRYLRLTPSVGVMFLVTITIFRFMGSGPMWSFITSLLKTSCTDKWWKFFLYIQNYTDPDTMCVNPTWYLSADMQMFILSPLVLIPTAMFLKRRFKETLLGLVVLTVISIIVPIFIRYFYDQVAGNIYTTHDRFNNFLIGITFGAFMRMKKQEPFFFSRLSNYLLWLVVIVVSLGFNIYWYYVLYYYDLLEYTLFMGFYRPVWCLCLVFMVYSCYHNQGGIPQWILTRPSFQILGRLTYNMYVLHVLVEVYGLATLKTNMYFSNYFVFYSWCGHIVVTMVVAVLWVLAFEFPMLTIAKYLLGDGSSGRKLKQ